jgi:flagellar biosynthesis protein FlhG
LKPFGLSNVIQLGRGREAPAEAPRVRPPPLPPGLQRRTRPKHVIAVGGGKGGIGKSLVSSSLGVALAQAGHKVCMVDADLGGANLHTCMGVGQPKVTLSDFINKRVMRLEELQVPTGVEGLSLIAGASDALDAANPKHLQKLKLIRNLQTLDVDYLLLDLGAGSALNVLDFFLLADLGILVLLPEPTSVENAYRFVKAAFFRKLQQLAEEYGIVEEVEAAISSKEGAGKTPNDFVNRVRARDRAAGERLAKDLSTFKVRLVVNQARTEQDLAIGDAVVGAWRKFFGLQMDYLGAVRYDDEAWRAVRKRRPLLLERPDSEAARQLAQIAGKVAALDKR